MAIKKAAVIGAGVMGAGIAAHLANAGIEVELLDIVPKSNPDRDAIAKGAIEKLLKNKPDALMHRKNAKKLRPGNTEDHMERLKDCDLIIEAVLEDPSIKARLFKRVDEFRKPGSIVASNTSTLPLHSLIADQSDAFKKDFIITHFFNPPRYMPLLELVTSQHNSKEMIAEITQFMDEKLGKGVVNCKDTPGFIANRIGTFWLQCAINEAVARKLTVEEADALIGKPVGVPKTGVFGLIDLVGLDLMPHISKNLLKDLPDGDGYKKIHKNFPVIDKMIADGYTGRKGKGGFYRLNEEGGKRVKESINLETGVFSESKKPKKMKAITASKQGGMRGLLETSDAHGDYVWSVLKQTLCYAAKHAHEIGDNIGAIDDAMKLGYGWKQGPFEMMDKIGVDYIIKRLKLDHADVPDMLQKAEGKNFYKTVDGKLNYMKEDGKYAEVKRPEGVLLLSDIKRASKPVASNKSASLWDIGDGVLCLEFHSKMNALDAKIMKMANKACDIIGDGKGKYKALVIHNEGEDFSVGANLTMAVIAAKLKQFWLVDRMVKLGQETYKRLKYAPFPVVGAPSGKALGGGCEILLHCSHVQAHAETYPGLVEVGVGLLPAWGGCAELMTRAKQNKKLPNGPMPSLAAVFETISMAKVGLSAFEAKDMMYFRETDGITMNKARLLADAKAKSLELAKDYKPEKPFEMQLAGASGLTALSLAVDGFYAKGAITPYDVVVSDRVARVLTGGDCGGPGITVTQDDIRRMERENFMALLKDKRTFTRINLMLKGGGRKEVEKVERAAEGTKKTRELREGLECGGIFSSLFSSKKKCVKKPFADAGKKKETANDNKTLPPPEAQKQKKAL